MRWCHAHGLDLKQEYGITVIGRRGSGEIKGKAVFRSASISLRDGQSGGREGYGLVAASGSVEAPIERGR